MTKKTNIPVALVAPLDWGLGHTTRCVPIIHALQKHGYKVIVAAEGAQEHLLLREFPDIVILPLRGYRIRYTQRKRLLAFKILQQVPKIIYTIRREHKWLQRQVQQYQIQLVISDNRFGLWSRQATSVFLTHQLQIQAPFAWLRRLLQIINYRHIEQYTACWVPDMASAVHNIAGHLSHPLTLPRIPTMYIGLLSRFVGKHLADQVQQEGSVADNNIAGKMMKYKWLFILSGPEPQRSLLEDKLLRVASQLQEPVLLLRARPGATTLPEAPSNCTVVNHLSSTEMEQAFAESEFIVSRSGYTTVMELLSLQKKAILIPTPGQTEQEYLAERLMRQQWSYCCSQGEDLLPHLMQAQTFNYQLPAVQSHQIDEALAQVFSGL